VDLAGLADDLLPILSTLAADSSVDPERIGLWGLSQGGWVALIAAEKTSLVRHVVLLSGPPMSPAEQGDAVVALGMRQKGMDEAAIAEALALNRQLTQVYRTDSGWDDAATALRAAESKPWFAAAQLGMIPRDSTYWRWLRTILDYDPIPALTRLTIPVLAVYGERDLLVPGPRSKAIVDSLAVTARGPRATILVPGAGHQLRAGNGDWSEAYWAGLVGWLEKLESGC
jgi:pimeloyl-ACP methyl ester carboxylesterase